MKILGIDFGGKSELKSKLLELQEEVQELTAMNNTPKVNQSAYVLPHFRGVKFNGEKNDGSLGPIVRLDFDYYELTERAWYYYSTNDIAQTVIQKYITWIIDTGLSLKANPIKKVLESEGITIDSEKFNDIVEARFMVWQKSKRSSFCGQKNFKETVKEAYLNSLISDVLTILRYENGIVTVQNIDGRRVIGNKTLENGNVVRDGVEINERGTEVAYWVYGKTLQEPQRIDAYSKTGIRCAFLTRSTERTIDYHRGLPIISVVMETIGKLDRYKEAVVSNAEEIAKIVYQVVHEHFSDGSDPGSSNGVLARLQRRDVEETVPVDDLGELLAKKVQATFGKRAVNNPVGAEIKPVQPSATIKEFEPFYMTNAHIVCAAIGIPPNVAFSLYTDSYSASRAATKDWDHTIDVKRDKWNDTFMSYVYQFWFLSEVISGKIDAPGFTEAVIKKNYMVFDSYTNARFTGAHFPHVDPVKEVEAERRKLGVLADAIPLTTIEQATESLGSGDSDSNMEQFADEVKISQGLGLVIENQKTTQE